MKIEKTYPFSITLATEIQAGNKTGAITLKFGQEPYRLVRELGTGRYILQNKDNPQYEETLDHSTEGRFVCRVVTEVTDIPRQLQDQPRFKYKKMNFIPAGTFEAHGLYTIKDISNKTDWPTEVTVSQFKYKDFYHAAATVNKHSDDIFWCVEAGCYVIPADHGLQKINI